MILRNVWKGTSCNRTRQRMHCHQSGPPDLAGCRPQKVERGHWGPSYLSQLGSFTLLRKDWWGEAGPLGALTHHVHLPHGPRSGHAPK